MKTVEEAYSLIAGVLLNAANDAWEKTELNTPIYKETCSGMSFSVFYSNRKTSTTVDWDAVDQVNVCALYLRDDLLKTTGQRIWGLTFTLYPDGKFNIDYDYNKPEGYEESDEVITGDEINASLSKLSTKTNT
jgi:hypothetical protein